MALTWRRLGSADYGFYLACEEKVSFVFFCARYSGRGELESFWVCDRYPREGMRWDENHLAMSSGVAKPPEIDRATREILKDLANCFYDDWLESFAATEVQSLLRNVTSGSGGAEDTSLAIALAGDLPLQVRPDRMAELIEQARLTEKNFLYVFLPNENLGKGSAALLEEKMRLFLELI